MITTTSTVKIQDNTIVRYAAPVILVLAETLVASDVIRCTIQVKESADGGLVAELVKDFDPDDLDATVQAASGYVRKYQGAAESVVKTYLEGLNVGATFTIS